MRLIHMADVHLGAVPDSGCPWSAFREKEIWETFERVIDQIREEKIDLLLIAGDLFHRQPLPSELVKVRQLFASIPDTQVVWMAGSSDYLREGSMYHKISWSENVHGLLAKEPQAVYLETVDTWVYGCSYHEKEIQDAIYASLRPNGQKGIHILLGYGGDSNHIPMKTEDSKEFDYVALGSSHTPGILVENQMAYAGVLEPISEADQGEHGVIYGEISQDPQGNHTQITFVPCACRSYITLNLRIHSATTQSALEQKLQDAIKQKGVEHIYTIKIQGYRNPERSFDLEALKAYGNIGTILDETRPCFDLMQLKKDKLGTKTGAYIHWFEKKRTQKDYKALDYGLQALLQDEENAKKLLEDKILQCETRRDGLQAERRKNVEEVQKKIVRTTRERSGIEQQLLVTRSEIRRLQLNRSVEEKHLEQERIQEEERRAQAYQYQEEIALEGWEMSENQELYRLAKEQQLEQQTAEVSVAPVEKNGSSQSGKVGKFFEKFCFWKKKTAGTEGLETKHTENDVQGMENPQGQQEFVPMEEPIPESWNQRVQRMRRQIRRMEVQIMNLREREQALALEKEEKRIYIENLREEIQEMDHPGYQEEMCEEELTSLHLAMTGLES